MRLRVLTPGGQEGVREPSSQKGDVLCLGGQLLAKMPLHTQEGLGVGGVGCCLRRQTSMSPSHQLIKRRSQEFRAGQPPRPPSSSKGKGVGRDVNDLTGYQGKA